MANEWQPNISKKIFITGGDDIQSGTLATYLAENATEVQYTPFDLSSLQLGAGAHTIKVKAKATGYQDSNFSNAVTYSVYQQLAAPVCSLSGDTLSWSAISNAVSYTLYVDSDVAQIGITALTFDLSTLSSLSSVAHTIQLKAIGTGYYTDSALSNSISYTPAPQLDAPTNISVTGTEATFDEVENAESYEFFVDGTSIGTYTPTTLISFSIQVLSSTKTYQAEDGMTWGEWINSAYNTDGYYVFGNSYVAVPNASGFLVTLNNVDVSTTDTIIANATYVGMGGGN